MALGNATHLLINIGRCNKKKLNDKKLVKKFLNKTPKRIGMTLIKKASVLPYIGDEDDDTGLSGFSLLAESHISFHSWKNRGVALIDVCSCKGFDVAKTVSYIIDTFEAQDVWMEVSNRDAFLVPSNKENVIERFPISDKLLDDNLSGDL